MGWKSSGPLQRPRRAFNLHHGLRTFLEERILAVADEEPRPLEERAVLGDLPSSLSMAMCVLPLWMGMHQQGNSPLAVFGEDDSISGIVDATCLR